MYGKLRQLPETGFNNMKKDPTFHKGKHAKLNRMGKRKSTPKRGLARHFEELIRGLRGASV